jgi:hypothetical protein
MIKMVEESMRWISRVTRMERCEIYFKICKQLSDLNGREQLQNMDEMREQ